MPISISHHWPRSKYKCSGSDSGPLYPLWLRCRVSSYLLYARARVTLTSKLEPTGIHPLGNSNLTQLSLSKSICSVTPLICIELKGVESLLWCRKNIHTHCFFELGTFKDSSVLAIAYDTSV
jgi:hypothetical protein